MNFGRSTLEFDLNRIPWKIRKPTVHIRPELAWPKSKLGCSPFTEQGRRAPWWLVVVAPSIQLAGDVGRRGGGH
jgi:hypothetical protein